MKKPFQATTIMIALSLLAPVFVTAQSTNETQILGNSSSEDSLSVEEELEKHILSPCFHRMANEIYEKEGYSEYMTQEEFLEFYESKIDLSIIKNSVQETVEILMEETLEREYRLQIYKIAFEMICPTGII